MSDEQQARPKTKEIKELIDTTAKILAGSMKRRFGDGISITIFVVDTSEGQIEGAISGSEELSLQDKINAATVMHNFSGMILANLNEAMSPAPEGTVLQ